MNKTEKNNLLQKYNCDFLIVGSGFAGLFAAYKASSFGEVILITKMDLNKSNSWLAQGGIAAAIGKHDSTHSHIEDTLATGRDLCHKNVVKILVEEGVDRVNEIIELGIEFDKKDGTYLFGIEGGHSKRRVLQAGGSSTGEALVNFMFSKVKLRTNITLLDNVQALELLKYKEKVIGINALDHNNNHTFKIFAQNTILATGGYSKIFSRNTNPSALIGEGISIALRAGAELRNMEFTQFHPTAFYSESGDTFLISETVRGEGAYLIGQNGERFLFNYHKAGELAPRDVVAAAIFTEIQKSNKDYIFLDMRHLGSGIIKKRFTNIYNFANAQNLDIIKELIPIAPAAHYSIGGIKTDINGQTNLNGLFAIGEAASTGVHGANRLASNSLIECLVFSNRAVLEASKNMKKKFPTKDIAATQFKFHPESQHQYCSTHEVVQSLFSKKFGIVREKETLNDLLNQINDFRKPLTKDTDDYYLEQLKGLLMLAKSIIKSALYREESRGTHIRNDFPDSKDKFLGNVVIKNSIIKFEKLYAEL